MQTRRIVCVLMLLCCLKMHRQNVLEVRRVTGSEMLVSRENVLILLKRFQELRVR